MGFCLVVNLLYSLKLLFEIIGKAMLHGIYIIYMPYSYNLSNSMKCPLCVCTPFSTLQNDAHTVFLLIVWCCPLYYTSTYLIRYCQHSVHSCLSCHNYDFPIYSNWPIIVNLFELLRLLKHCLFFRLLWSLWTTAWNSSGNTGHLFSAII